MLFPLPHDIWSSFKPT
uniref:Uncharacterized protein n=1 Tax=Setaria italica TaxID=4555 RepID=A0A0Q3QB50_SETIT